MRGNRGDFRYIYVFECPPSCKKIGIADDPAKRLKTVQAYNPAKVRLAFSRPVPADIARWAELRIHQELAPHHVHGEWFAVTLAIARRSIIAAIEAAYEEANARRAKHRDALAEFARQRRPVEYGGESPLDLAKAE